jgi:hypothetical protein
MEHMNKSHLSPGHARRGKVMASVFSLRGVFQVKEFSFAKYNLARRRIDKIHLVSYYVQGNIELMYRESANSGGSKCRY